MSYLAPILEIGGGGGSAFNFDGIDCGATLEKMGVWAGGWQIKAIKIWLTNGQSMQYGNPGDGPYSEYTFKPGEHITSLSLWGNGAGTRLGAIKFTTTLGKTFFPQMTSWGLKHEYPIDIGSGICMGVIGRSSSDIDCLGFIFLNIIKSTVLTNINYPTLHNIIPQVATEELKSMTYHNDTTVDQQYTLETTKKIIKKSTWSVSNKIESTFSISVKAGIPGVEEIGSEFSYTVGVESTYSLEYSEENEEKFSFPVHIPHGKTLDAKMTIGRAVVELPYTGTVKITCHNDFVLKFNISGIYNGLTYTTADIHVKEHHEA
ncbi:aerolysin-like protein [Pygocentrus nattereri]|uniref:aerolysin-like protein n=1 Tax=Pygocentrus nattereri TaxID=42514 RepID=UPI0018918C95|nr:aerolysin-like protein [Pygocentrus nattereri]